MAQTRIGSLRLASAIVRSSRLRTSGYPALGSSAATPPRHPPKREIRLTGLVEKGRWDLPQHPCARTVAMFCCRRNRITVGVEFVEGGHATARSALTKRGGRRGAGDGQGAVSTSKIPLHYPHSPHIYSMQKSRPEVESVRERGLSKRNLGGASNIEH